MAFVKVMRVGSSIFSPGVYHVHSSVFDLGTAYSVFPISPLASVFHQSLSNVNEYEEDLEQTSVLFCYIDFHVQCSQLIMNIQWAL